jgi:hypothetical protein
LAQAAFNAANTANVALVQASFDKANVANTTAEAGFAKANAANVLAQSAFNQANTSAQTVPQNAQTTNYVLQLTDAGKHIYYTQAANVNLYIPNAGQTVFANGHTITIISRTTSSANVTVTPNTGVSMYLAGNSTAKSTVTLNSYSMATLLKIGTDTWMVSGTGAT